MLRSSHHGARQQSHVLLTGASGFIGSTIARQAKRRGLRISPVVRRHSEGAAGFCLSDYSIRSLSVLAERASRVVHCVSHVGTDASMSWNANVESTDTLIEACRRTGAPAPIYISTAAVYGHGPHRPGDASPRAVRPASVASRHRAIAEELVLEAGGVVLRPHLVIGRGDRWVIPGIAHVAAQLGAPPHGAHHRSSVIHVNHLAEVALDVRAPTIGQPGLVDDVAPSNAPRTSQLVSFAAQVMQVDTSPSVRVSSEEELRGIGLTRHQADLLLQDHWYLSGPVADSLPPRASNPLRASREDLTWYRSLWT